MEDLLINQNKFASFYLMASDCSTIHALILHVQQSNFINSILPYYSLYYTAVEDFLGISFFEDPAIEELTKDIRNSLKLMQNKNKIGKEILSTDQRQDEQFKGRPYSPLSSGNSGEAKHWNLGISFDRDYHIVSNTQMMQYNLQIENMFSEDLGNRNRHLGHDISSMVCYCYKEFSTIKAFKFDDPPINKVPDIPYYLDLNTDEEQEFFNLRLSKEINLQILYILCSLNFVKYILLPVLPSGNLWGFRVKYIALHYALLGIEQLIKKLEDFSINSLENFLTSFSQLRGNIFRSKLRNCMMHYDLVYQGVPAIDSMFFDMSKPYFGLIESCCSGMSFEEFSKSLDTFLDECIDVLSSQFTVNSSRLKEYTVD